MEYTEIAQSKKAEAARRQLGTALHLWLADLDPISVHALVSGGCEIAEALAKKVGKPFSAFTLDVHRDLSESELRKLRNTFWNAIKHANQKDGGERDDESLLSTPLESENEARLAEGWYDLMQVKPAPVEAQALVLWFMSKHGNQDELDDGLAQLFPNLQSLPLDEQKALLRRQIEFARSQSDVMTDPRIVARPLIIPA